MVDNPILQVKQIRKLFDKHNGIHQLSFDVQEGEFLSILGPSGGGKSTLLHLISGLIQPDDGEISIHQKVVSSKKIMVQPQHRGVNMVFQNYALWPHMNVYEHINFGFKNQKLAKSERHEKIMSLIQLLELRGLEKRLPAELSGGQQQRVAIARALSTQPKILLLDEPMSNLDGYLRLQMRSQLKVMFKDLGTTVLYVTHDPVEALAMADRLLIIKGGRMEQLDTPLTCYSKPASPWVAGLLGAINRNDSSMALDKGRIIKIGDVVLQSLNPAPQTEYIYGQRIEVRSRPEDITIHLEEPKHLPSTHGIIQPTVLNSGFEGKHWRITLLTEPNVIYYALHHSYIEPGTKVWATMESNKLFAYPVDED